MAKAMGISPKRQEATMRPLIAIDDWKLPVFREGLEMAGYTFAVGPGVSPGTLFLTLEIEQEKLGDLAIVVKQCYVKAVQMKN